MFVYQTVAFTYRQHYAVKENKKKMTFSFAEKWLVSIKILVYRVLVLRRS